MMLYILGRVVCEGERGRGEEEGKQTERGRDGVREDGRLVDLVGIVWSVPAQQPGPYLSQLPYSCC